MTRTSGRIVISPKVDELLTLGVKIYQKHDADGSTSPLLNLDGVQWSVVGPTLSMALGKHAEAEEYKNRMEAAYRERDLYIPAIKEAVASSRNLLKALNQKNPKRLSEWGFKINDSVQSSKSIKAAKTV